MKSEGAVENTDTEGTLFASLTSAIGLALGELLLALETPENLGQCLHSIGIAAQATLLEGVWEVISEPIVQASAVSWLI
jgi:hypothetical protein